MGKIEIYTDGSATNNGMENSYGAYGYVVLLNGVLIEERSEFVGGITNNQMELSAATQALLYLLDSGLYKHMVVLYSDSQYVVNGINEWIDGWKRKKWLNVKNPTYWKELDGLVGQFENITFKWCKGHSDNEWNNYVDELCTSTVSKNLV